MSPTLKIFNTLTNKKEELIPLVPKEVKIYACGVTVYDRCHLGHAMQAILFDTFVRYLRYRGFLVTYVRNYTDVDDKIIERSASLGISPLELSSLMIEYARKDMELLGVMPADFEPKVSDFIPQILSFISRLIERGAAYVASNGDVYYRVRSKKDYGKLSNQNVSALMEGVRKEGMSGKEDPLDFALWKSDSTPGASWESPWGMGRPGWHIECSVMSSEILGHEFDIHGGGRDLVFPHHENEIAQSESCHGCYARYWMHTGLLTIEKKKMSKSLGNFLTIEEALQKFDVDLLRFNIFQYHYSSNIDFNHDAFVGGLKKIYYFYSTLQKVEEFLAQTPEGDGKYLDGFDLGVYREELFQAMDDDFNIPKAFTYVQKFFQILNDLMDLKGKKALQKRDTLVLFYEFLKEILFIFGMMQKSPSVYFQEIHERYLKQINILEQDLEFLLLQRRKARESKDFLQSDQIRDQIQKWGIQVLDTKNGQIWRLSEKAFENLIRSDDSSVNSRD